MAPIGKHIKTRQLCLSELIKKTCKSLDINYNNLQLEHKFINLFNKFLGMKAIRNKICSYYFHVKINKDGSYNSFGDLIAEYNNNYYKKLGLYLSFGLPLFLNYLGNIFRKKRKPYSIKHYIRIAFRSWPTIGNIDLNEIGTKCTTCSYDNGRLVPFCINNIEQSVKNGL